METTKSLEPLLCPWHIVSSSSNKFGDLGFGKESALISSPMCNVTINNMSRNPIFLSHQSHPFVTKL